LNLFTGITMDYSSAVMKEIVYAAHDEKENVMLHFYREEVMTELLKDAPDVIGISIEHSPEIIPAFTLMRLIKEANQKINIVLGGPLITMMHSYFHKPTVLGKFFDAIALGPGEYLLEYMMSNKDTDIQWDKAPNCLYKKQDRFVQSSVSREFDINDAACAEWPDKRPGAIVCMETAHYCYWGKCAFCNWACMRNKQGQDSSSLYQEMAKQNIDRDLSFIKTHYDPIYIRLTNSVTSAKQLEMLTQKNSEYGFRFYAFIRAEKEFTDIDFCKRLSEGGLAAIAYGIESGTERINRLYNKGVSFRQIEKIAKNCQEVGIGVRLFCVINFPDETEDEMKRSYEYFKYLRDQYKCLLYVSDFRMHRDVSAWSAQDRYGVKRIIAKPAGNYKYLIRNKKYPRLKVKRDPFRLWWRGKEDLPYYYACESVLGKKADTRKDILAEKILKELNASSFLERNFFELLERCSNGEFLPKTNSIEKEVPQA